jgi:hypothetical protein
LFFQLILGQTLRDLDAWFRKHRRVIYAIECLPDNRWNLG